MHKDSTRDYIIATFKLYAVHGQPDESMINKLNQRTPVKLDLLAAYKTMKYLRSSGKGYICEAIEAVYFSRPLENLNRNEISNRVISFAVNNYISERNVWRWLKEARNICAVYRGLNTASIEDIIDNN